MPGSLCICLLAMRPLVLFLLLYLLVIPGWAQGSRITGRVVDARTKLPIPFAAIELRTKAAGVLADENGYFLVSGLVDVKQDSLTIRALGYTPVVVSPKQTPPNQPGGAGQKSGPGHDTGQSWLPVRAAL